ASNSARCATVKNSWSAYLAERCSGVSVSSVQMPCKSGSPQGVFSAGNDAVETVGAWAEVRVVDTEMAALATPAMATVIIEAESRSRIDDLPAPCYALS